MNRGRPDLSKIMLPYKISNYADGRLIAETVIKIYKINAGIRSSIFIPN